MSRPRLRIAFCGLSITSSWGNGHATTYRGLVRELAGRGHEILFLERDVPWYAQNRDLPKPPHCRTVLYRSLSGLYRREAEIANADMVIVGSYVPEGIAVGEWVLAMARGVTAFYDIDTPVTLAALENGGAKYITREQIARYHLYLSFTGGPTLRHIERTYGAHMARPLYCSVDISLYHPARHACKWDLGYMGTYSADRQPPLERLLLEPARRWRRGRFAVVGPQYPRAIKWPPNVERKMHISPDKHRAFYNAQNFTLNITRADMIAAGYSPSVRLFEAAACGTPVISDHWPGLNEFFEPDREILLASSADEVLDYLQNTSAAERTGIGQAARRRVLAEHTAAHRALELERYALELVGREALTSQTRLNAPRLPTRRSHRAR